MRRLAAASSALSEMRVVALTVTFHVESELSRTTAFVGVGGEAFVLHVKSLCHAAYSLLAARRHGSQ